MDLIKDFLIASALTLLTFFAPAAVIILVVFSFVFLDIITAYCRVKKQHKTNKKIRWTSRTFITGFVPKLFLYTIPILAFYGLDFVLLNEFVKYFIPIEHLSTKLIALGFVYSELKSIDENWKIIFGKGLFKYVTDTLNFGKQVKKKINEVNTDKDEDNTSS